MNGSPQVSPQMMQMLRQGGGSPAAQQQPPGVGAPGPTSQMPQPQKKEGIKEAAMVNVHIAMNMLEQALPVFGTESKEGQKVLDVLRMLGKSFGKQDSGDLVPAEIRQMVASLPQSGGGSEVQRMLMQSAGRPQQQQPQSQPQPMAA